MRIIPRTAAKPIPSVTRCLLHAATATLYNEFFAPAEGPGAQSMNAPDKAFLNREYNNRELVPEHPRYFAHWQQSSAQARSRMSSQLDLAYGTMPGEKLDLFPARKGDGSCFMFIHGGYWRSLDKSDFSFLAPALVDAGISLAVVNYDLCPRDRKSVV